MLEQYAAVAALDTGVTDAEGRQAALLAPLSYQQAVRLLDSALDAARAANKVLANEKAKAGLAEVERVNTQMAAAQDVLREVLSTRGRAQNAGAGALFAGEFQDADIQLRKAARLVEEGDAPRAQTMRPELIESYAQLELRALKTGYAEAARQAITQARARGAAEWAPKTFESAEQELALVASVLEADRTRTEEGNAHAQKARWLAGRAEQIAQMAESFDEADYSLEDLLLWHQGQLQSVRDTITTQTLPFDRPNAKVVYTLRSDVSSMLSSVADIRMANRASQAHIEKLEAQLRERDKAHNMELTMILRNHEQQLEALRNGTRAELAKARTDGQKQVAALQNRLSAEANAQASADQARRESEYRFVQVQALFNENEAEVFRQGDNVIIRLRGFEFAPGKAEIEAKNFGLLNKVGAAISTFPRAKVEISGHTDSVGRAQRNLQLSVKRATNVTEFLRTVGEIDAGRLTSDGFGAEKPIASNDTSEGRATNRRIDVTILNQ